MGSLIPVVMILIGIAIGAALGWFLLRAKARASNAAELATLKERLTGKETELQKLQTGFDAALAEHNRARDHNSQLNAELAAERRAAQARQESFSQAADELSGRFAELSQKALNANNQSFLELANATLQKFQHTAKGDLEQRQQAIDQLVKPLKESLEKVDGKIGEMEKTRAGAYAELREQVKALATSQTQLQAETGNLVKALRTPHIRGRWGEIQLRRVVELAGMLQYCDFTEQETVAGEDGRIRPDLIVRLPGGRTIGNNRRRRADD